VSLSRCVVVRVYTCFNFFSTPQKKHRMENLPIVCSSVHAQTGTVCAASRAYIAGIAQNVRLVVRCLPNLAVHSVFTALDRIEKISFSPDSTLVLAVVPSQGVVHVWSLDDPDWSCRIDSGLAGVSKAEFHPCSGHHILVWSDFNLRLDVWDLRSGRRGNLKHVKSTPLAGFQNFAAVLSRNKFKNSIQIIDMAQEQDDLKFSVVQSFLVPGVADLAGLVWTAAGSGLVAFESPLSDQVHLLDLHGQILSSHSLTDHSGVKQLGVKVEAHSRTILALGCFDESIRFFSITNKLEFIVNMSLKSDEINVVDDCPIVLRETLAGEATLRERNMFHLGGSNEKCFPVVYRDAPREDTVSETLQTVKIPSIDRCNPSTNYSNHSNRKNKTLVGPPRGGVIALAMSPDGAFLAAQTDEKSSVVFLVEIEKMKIIFVLIHRKPVRSMRWNPAAIANKSQLAVVTGDSRVFIWNPTMDNRTIELKDSSMQAVEILWNSQGTILIVSDQEKVCSVQLHESREHYGG